MLTCPFWMASIKGVTPHLSLLSGLYWHLGGKTKARTELLAAPKSLLHQLLCIDGTGDNQQMGSEMAYIKPIRRPLINLS